MTDYPNVTYERALSFARRWYYTAIRSLVDEAIRDVVTRRDESNDVRHERLTEWIHSAVGSHEITMYTGQAEMALAASDNADAVYGEELSGPEARVWSAMVADCWELLDDRKDEWRGGPSLPDPPDTE